MVWQSGGTIRLHRLRIVVLHDRSEHTLGLLRPADVIIVVPRAESQLYRGKPTARNAPSRRRCLVGTRWADSRTDGTRHDVLRHAARGRFVRRLPATAGVDGRCASRGQYLGFTSHTDSRPVPICVLRAGWTTDPCSGSLVATCRFNRHARFCRRDARRDAIQQCAQHLAARPASPRRLADRR